MKDHKLCRPPRADDGPIVRVLRGGRLFARDIGTPAEALLVENETDASSATIYVVDCACVGEPQCPRQRMFTWARETGGYEAVSVVTRVASPARALPRRARQKPGRSSR